MFFITKSEEINQNSGLGLGTFLGKTLLERQNAKLIFKDAWLSYIVY